MAVHFVVEYIYIYVSNVRRGMSGASLKYSTYSHTHYARRHAATQSVSPSLFTHASYLVSRIVVLVVSPYRERESESCKVSYEFQHEMCFMKNISHRIRNEHIIGRNC